MRYLLLIIILSAAVTAVGLDDIAPPTPPPSFGGVPEEAPKANNTVNTTIPKNETATNATVTATSTTKSTPTQVVQQQTEAAGVKETPQTAVVAQAPSYEQPAATESIGMSTFVSWLFIIIIIQLVLNAVLAWKLATVPRQAIVQQTSGSTPDQAAAYVRDLRERGMTKQQVRETLRSAGWKDDDIDLVID